MRYPDWQARLVAYLRSIQRLPHVYGQHDCALFCANAVNVMTGEDYAEEFRGKYDTKKAGLLLMKEHGYSSHVALAADKLKAIPPAFATPGDLAVLKGNIMGVVQGRFIYVLTPDNLAMLDLLDATRAFKV
ncbi:MAG: DUF6950 family protein [Paracoccaceae bacterium]